MTLAREIRAALLREFADQLGAATERADMKLAGRTVAPLLAHELIDAGRAIAAAARGEAATP